MDDSLEILLWLFLPIVAVPYIIKGVGKFTADPELLRIVGSLVLLLIVWRPLTWSLQLKERRASTPRAQLRQAFGGVLLFVAIACMLSIYEELRAPRWTHLAATGIGAAAEELIYRFALPALIYVVLSGATRMETLATTVAVVLSQMAFVASHLWLDSVRADPARMIGLMASGLALVVIARVALFAAVATHASLNWATVSRIDNDAPEVSVIIALFGLAVGLLATPIVARWIPRPLFRSDDERLDTPEDGAARDNDSCGSRSVRLQGPRASDGVRI